MKVEANGESIVLNPKPSFNGDLGHREQGALSPESLGGEMSAALVPLEDGEQGPQSAGTRTRHSPSSLHCPQKVVVSLRA